MHVLYGDTLNPDRFILIYGDFKSPTKTYFCKKRMISYSAAASHDNNKKTDLYICLGFYKI